MTEAPTAEGWGDPVASPTALLRHTYTEDRPQWLKSPWRWSTPDGRATYCAEPDTLDARAVHDLNLLAEIGFEIRVEPAPAGHGLLVQLRKGDHQ